MFIIVIIGVEGLGFLLLFELIIMIFIFNVVIEGVIFIILDIL